MPKWFGGSALNPDGIIPSHRQWLMQWNRVSRYYERSKLIKKRSLGRQGLTKFEIDDLTTFFLQAFHLRDWIISCCPEQKENLANLFDNFEMACCRDIANGFKHKRLGKPSVDADFNFYREYDHFPLEAGRKNRILYRVAFLGKDQNIKKWDVFELIEIIYNYWESFINKNLAQ